MKLFEPDAWTPSPDLLAAYADGEIADDELRARLENWLLAHPEAAADLESQLDLTRLMAATTPAEPSALAWAKVWRHVEARPTRGRRWAAVLWFTGVAVAGAAAVVALVVVRQSSEPVRAVDAARLVSVVAGNVGAVKMPHADEVEVFKVATADEVEIIHVAGADTGTLLVGRLPLAGPLVLLAPHEIEAQLPANNGSGTEWRIGTNAPPMLWTPLQPQNDDERDDAPEEAGL